MTNDDDQLSMLADGLITLPGLDQPGVPVKVVQDDLHGLDLRVLREDLIQHVGGVVIGNGDVPELPLLLPPLHVVEQMGLPDDLSVAHPVHVVEQIVVKIVHAAPLQLPGEERLHFLLPGDGEGG